MELRIHPEHIQGYRGPFDALPEEAKKEIEEASACKRLIDPDACGPRCRMGYAFLIGWPAVPGMPVYGLPAHTERGGRPVHEAVFRGGTAGGRQS